MGTDNLACLARFSPPLVPSGGRKKLTFERVDERWSVFLSTRRDLRIQRCQRTALSTCEAQFRCLRPLTHGLRLGELATPAINRSLNEGAATLKTYRDEDLESLRTVLTW